MPIAWPELQTLFTGAGFANAYLGVPDMGLTSLKEVADQVAAIRDAIEIPILADGDTSFGNALNARRTVQLMERAGANALLIEDQVYPKRCGHFEDKGVVSKNEMVQKICGDGEEVQRQLVRLHSHHWRRAATQRRPMRVAGNAGRGRGRGLLRIPQRGCLRGDGVGAGKVSSLEQCHGSSWPYSGEGQGNSQKTGRAAGTGWVQGRGE